MEKVRPSAGVIGAARHNKRAIPAELRAADCDIDQSLTHLNRAIRGPDTPEGVAALAKRLRIDAGADDVRKNEVSAVEIVCSLPAGSGIDPFRYFTDCDRWAEQRFGGSNMLCTDIHLDQPQKHCHILILPLVNGKMNGSDMIGYKASIKGHTDSFFENVAKHYGLRRAPPKLTSTEKSNGAKLVRDYLRRLAGDAQRYAAMCQPFYSAVERDPTEAMASLGLSYPARPLKGIRELARSKGAGHRTEAAEAASDARMTARAATAGGHPQSESGANHIGFHAGPKHQTLSCVGIDVFPAASATQSEPEPPTPSQFTRIPDADQSPDDWDSTTGEHRPRPATQHYGKTAAGTLVQRWMEGESEAA